MNHCSWTIVTNHYQPLLPSLRFHHEDLNLTDEQVNATWEPGGSGCCRSLQPLAVIHPVAEWWRELAGHFCGGRYSWVCEVELLVWLGRNHTKFLHFLVIYALGLPGNQQAIEETNKTSKLKNAQMQGRSKPNFKGWRKMTWFRSANTVPGGLLSSVKELSWDLFCANILTL